MYFAQFGWSPSAVNLLKEARADDVEVPEVSYAPPVVQQGCWTTGQRVVSYGVSQLPALDPVEDRYFISALHIGESVRTCAVQVPCSYLYSVAPLTRLIVRP